jgi:hypothetical protein
MSILNSSLNEANIISNNDTLLVNELFAMKMNYVDKSGDIVSDSFTNSIGGSGSISTNVKLFGTTSSLYDSNLKIDISLNNSPQYSSGEEWSVDFDRSSQNMNYFACINSYLSNASEDSPFYILENSANIYSLGNNPESVYTDTGTKYGTHKYFTVDSSDIMIPHDISNSLDSNWCRSELDNSLQDVSGTRTPYVYENYEFNTFKIIQDKPHVNAVVTDSSNNNVEVNGSLLPFKYNSVDISSTTFDIPNIFDSSNANWNNIGDGFEMSLTVGKFQDGGYEIDTATNAFTLDNSDLTKNINNPYLTIDVQNSTHTFDITNGTVEAVSSTSSGNTAYITVGPEHETLEQTLYNVSGQIVIYTNEVNNRVNYPSGKNNSLTDSVNVYYNSTESGGKTVISDSPNNLTTTDDVQYTIEVITGSTTDVNLVDDKRNLAKNNNALLVLATENSNISVNDMNFVLTSSLSTDPDYIQIVSIENKSILADKAPIKDQSGNTISGATSSVYVQHIDLSGLNYEEYRLVLNTKTVSDVSTLLQLSDGWSLATTDESVYIKGNASKTGVIRDDYLFMTNASDLSGQPQDQGLDITMTYAFQVASPVITNTQAVKHRIAISFYDLLDNTTYDTTETVFYLDDQDITLINLNTNDPVQDLSSCTNITSTNSSYPVTNYNFKKFTRTRTFNASFDCKFNFYTNLNFVTPLIQEISTYYEIYDLQGNKLPSYLLRYFQCTDDNQSLSYTSVVLDEFYSVTFDLTQKVLSILNVQLYGTNDGENYEAVDGKLDFLDPFFNLKTTIAQFDGRQDATGIINIQFGEGIVDQESYYIDMQNKPGQNMSFSAKRYIYTVGTTDPLLTNFSYYNNFYNNLSDMTDCDIDFSFNGITNVLTVYDGTTSNDVLLTIEHPTTFIDNYNVIVCSWPLVEVRNNLINDNLFYSLALNNEVQVDSGVYYIMKSGSNQSDTESFTLVKDRFKLNFCQSLDFSNNNTDYLTEADFTESLINTPLTCTQEYQGNQTKSVTFSQVRGYYYVVGGDVIRLVRTPSTAVFKLKVSSINDYINDTTATKSFDNLYVGKTLTVDSVSDTTNPPRTYNLGLKINMTESIISDTDYNSSGYIIKATVADYFANIDSNPYYPDIIDILSNGYITDPSCSDVLSPYIKGVKPSCIKSYGKFVLVITRNVPDLKIYSLNEPSYTENPSVSDTDTNRKVVDPYNTVWYYAGSFDYNEFLWTGYVLSNLNVRRIAAEGKDANSYGHVVFYNDYYSYYVVAPPSISVYGYPTAGPTQFNQPTSLPISANPVFFKAYDIKSQGDTFDYIDETNANTTLTFKNNGNFNYAHYLYHANDKYYLMIEGNYINIAIYSGGVATVGSGLNDDPIIVDSNINNRLENIYNGLISDIGNDENYSSYIDSNLNYDICYNQILLETASHNNRQNIQFSIGNAFVSENPNTNPGNPSYYLRLISPLGTTVSFYQTNVIYNDASLNNHLDFSLNYYLIVDRYDANPNINYDEILRQSTLHEIFFPVSKHYTKEIRLGDIVDPSGYPIDQQEYLNEIELVDISNSAWVRDLSFSLQYVGLTITSLSKTGTDSVGDLLKYNPRQSLQSKGLYVKLQDAIRVKNVLGNNLFRVTNSGNVQTSRIVTSKVSLYSQPNVLPNVNSNIGGSEDIISYFAQNTIGF